MVSELEQTSTADAPEQTKTNDAFVPESNEASNASASDSIGPPCASASETVEVPNKITRKSRSKLFRRRPYQSSEQQEGEFLFKYAFKFFID